jgi:hypothetical protein
MLAATAVYENTTDPLSGLVLSDVAQLRPTPVRALVDIVSAAEAW